MVISATQCEEVGFDLDVLHDMYRIYSPSYHEKELNRYLVSILEDLDIPHIVGDQGEVYDIRPNRPLVCAHLDQVGHQSPCVEVVQQGRILRGKNGDESAGLGADDKNGVWIILNLLKKHGEGISFLFSTQEECGGMTDVFMESLGRELTDTIPYALVFDRKGGGDIIGVDNNYCMPDLEDEIAALGEQFGYRPSPGGKSDCNRIAEYVACVNLSCGYYSAHTDQEYTNIDELFNALRFGCHLVERLERDIPYMRVENL